MVLTSSFAAISYGRASLDRTFTDDDWTDARLGVPAAEDSIVDTAESLRGIGLAKQTAAKRTQLMPSRNN